jgi:hypothetical protein
VIKKWAAVLDHLEENTFDRLLPQRGIVMEIANELSAGAPIRYRRVSGSSSVIDLTRAGIRGTGGIGRSTVGRAGDLFPTPPRNAASRSSPGNRVPDHGVAPWRCGLFW